MHAQLSWAPIGPIQPLLILLGNLNRCEASTLNTATSQQARRVQGFGPSKCLGLSGKGKCVQSGAGFWPGL